MSWDSKVKESQYQAKKKRKKKLVYLKCLLSQWLSLGPETCFDLALPSYHPFAPYFPSPSLHSSPEPLAALQSPDTPPLSTQSPSAPALLSPLHPPSPQISSPHFAHRPPQPRMPYLGRVHPPQPPHPFSPGPPHPEPSATLPLYPP